QCSPSDPISIIEQAQAGKQFRCVEYAIVLAGVLASIGFPARAIGLMTQDVETRRYGAGHLATEVYLPSLGKWVMIDGQFRLIPTVNNIPVSALELSQALYERPKNVNTIHTVKSLRVDYKKWIKPYLFYFTTNNHQIYGDSEIKCREICLGPEGMPEPKKFQVDSPQNIDNYTHKIKDFYPDFK